MEMKKALHPKAEDTTSCYPREEKNSMLYKKSATDKWFDFIKGTLFNAIVEMSKVSLMPHQHWYDKKLECQENK